jgi:arginyl-tRNA synthetase
MILRWPSMVQKAVNDLDPHRLALELYNIAKEFHHWYQASADKGDMFVTTDRNKTGHNVALLTLVNYIIIIGLELLGIKPLQKM